MPRTITGGAPGYRSTAAMDAGRESGDSIVRTERWRPPDRRPAVPGDGAGGRSEPPLVGRAIGAYLRPAGRPPD
ncbi:hypothetical protein GR129_07215 [Streptomyces sp. HF10]|nr:hypothetical protein GR129_07215 [Streptomyces sp. HF10]